MEPLLNIQNSLLPFHLVMAQAIDTPSVGNVIVTPLVLCLLGVAIYAGVAFTALNDFTKAPIRHVGTALVVIAFLMSGMTMLHLTGEMASFYKAALSSDKLLFAHYLVPVLILAAIITLVVLDQRRNPNRSWSRS